MNTTAWMPLLVLLPLGLMFLGATVALVLLLAHPKTRATTLWLLGVLGATVLLLLLGFVSLLFVAKTATQVSRPPTVQTYAPPATKPPVPAAKQADELSQSAASRAAGILRTMVRTLGRTLVDEGQVPAVKNGTAQPPAPGPNQSRPAWVNAPPQPIGDTYQMSIAIGPYTTRAECDAKLPDALQEALDQYVNISLGDQAVDDIRLPADYLRGQLVKAQWEETRQHSVGPMTWLHVLLQFDRKIKDRILEEHRQAIIGQRLHAVGRWAAIALGLLTVAFGYLKTDLATGGAYRGRLRLAAAAAILGLLGVVVVIVL